MVSKRPSRRSTQQPKSYRVDKVFQHLDFLDSDASESGVSKSAQGSRRKSSNSDEGGEEDESDADEFTLPAGEEEEDADDFQDDDVTSGEEDDEDEDLEDDSDEEMSITPKITKRGQLLKGPKPKTRKGKALAMGRGFGPGHGQPPSRFTVGTGTKMRQRGIEEWVKGGQEYRFATFFGPTEPDVRPALDTRDYWHSQNTLPCRSQGDLRRTFWVTEAAQEKEETTLRTWYEDHGKAFFEASQVTHVLSKDDGMSYMINSGPESTNLLVGDLQTPQVHTLKKGESMSTSKGFEPSQKRRGWSFHLGSRIQEIQWAPNEEGNIQYLAIAVEQKSTTSDHAPFRYPHAPAFTATEPFPASVQIWAFDSLENGDLHNSIQPRLEQVICTDWGAPKALRWCPVGISPSVQSTDGKTVHLGLLAGIWSDGKVRILDISHQKPWDGSVETQYIQYSRAAFEIELPETIPTCIHWLSNTSLGVATSSGVFAIWTLTRPGMFPTSEQDTTDIRPQPWFHRQLTHTYILTLSSGYPSKPQFISITAADGFDRLFDLRSPLTDTTWSARGRMLVLAQAWHDHTQSFISPDEYYMIKHSVIRSYHRNVYSVRIDSMITACATSPVHPCILVGGSDGIVMATNPVMKVLNTKTRPWQLPWFKHEWRRPVDKISMHVKGDEASAEAVSSGEHVAAERSDDGANPGPDTSASSENSPSSARDPILSQPLTRITEGYSPYQVGIGHGDDDSRRFESVKFITTHEKLSAISQLAWNPNLKFGTWAAAGTNSGYLRVEDLGD